MSGGGSRARGLYSEVQCIMGDGHMGIPPNRMTDRQTPVCWLVVKMRKTTSYPESHITKMFRGSIELLQRAQILKVNCCLKVHNARVNSASPMSG